MPRPVRTADNPPSVPAFVAKYSDKQKAAVCAAPDHPGETGKRIAERAAAGTLALHGERIGPFEIAPQYVLDLRRKHRRRLESDLRSEIVAQAPKDAVETLRRRLVSAADSKLARVELLLSKGEHEKVDGEQLRQLARAVREIAAIPGPAAQPAPGARPGYGPMDTRTGGPTRGGLAGQIQRSVAPQGIAPVPSDPLPQAEPLTETTGADDAPPSESEGERIYGEESEDPGSFARARIAQLVPPGGPA